MRTLMILAVALLAACTSPTDLNPGNPIAVTATVWDAAPVPCTIRLDVTGGPATIESWGYYGAAQGFAVGQEVAEAFGSTDVGPAGLYALVELPGVTGSLTFWVTAASQRPEYAFVEC